MVASNRLAILWALSTRRQSPFAVLKVAAPRLGKPLGWKRWPCSGLREIANSRRDWSLRTLRSTVMVGLLGLRLKLVKQAMGGMLRNRERQGGTPASGQGSVAKAKSNGSLNTVGSKTS